MIYQASILSVEVVGYANNINHVIASIEATSVDEARGIGLRLGKKLYGNNASLDFGFVQIFIRLHASTTEIFTQRRSMRFRLRKRLTRVKDSI